VKVRPSDTLAALALRFNVAKSELKRLNSILTDNELHARATIR
jgi:LysM repeat protein